MCNRLVGSCQMSNPCSLSASVVGVSTWLIGTDSHDLGCEPLCTLGFASVRRTLGFASVLSVPITRSIESCLYSLVFDTLNAHPRITRPARVYNAVLRLRLSIPRRRARPRIPNSQGRSSTYTSSSSSTTSLLVLASYLLRVLRSY